MGMDGDESESTVMGWAWDSLHFTYITVPLSIDAYFSTGIGVCYCITRPTSS